MDLRRAAAYHARAMTPFKHPRLSLRRSSRVLVGAGLWLCALGCPASPPVRDADNAPAAPAEPPASAPEAAPATAPAAPTPAPTPTASDSREGARDARGKEEILAVIAANRDKVRACYEAALKNNPGIQGDLMVAFVINPDGSVKSAEVNSSESEIHLPELDSCAIDVLRTLKFPASSRGLESKVNYPFNFNPRRP